MLHTTRPFTTSLKVTLYRGIERICHQEATNLSCYLLSLLSVNSEFLFLTYFDVGEKFYLDLCMFSILIFNPTSKGNAFST